jgi:hypothetical protein
MKRKTGSRGIMHQNPIVSLRGRVKISQRVQHRVTALATARDGNHWLRAVNSQRRPYPILRIDGYHNTVYL